MDTEDILTAFIQKEKMEEEDTHDFFVVIQCPSSKRRLFLTPGDLSKLDLHNLPYSQQIAVCRLVRIGGFIFIYFILFVSKERRKKLEGETVIDIQKYDLYQVEGKIMKRILIFDLAQECE